MTKYECAVITAYTEVSMLKGDDLKYLYEYLEKFTQKPVYTHEIPSICEKFRKEIEKDFCLLCANASEVEGEWIRNVGYPRKVYCSMCLRTYVRNENIIDGRGDNLLPKYCEEAEYCPHCGTKMKIKNVSQVIK